MKRRSGDKQTYKPGSVLRRLSPTEAVTIHLAPRFPARSSDQPGDRTGILMSPYSVLLRAGFTQPVGLPAAGGLLPHHFTLTPKWGGMFLWHFP